MMCRLPSTHLPGLATAPICQRLAARCCTHVHGSILQGPVCGTSMGALLLPAEAAAAALPPKSSTEPSPAEDQLGMHLAAATLASPSPAVALPPSQQDSKTEPALTDLPYPRDMPPSQPAAGCLGTPGSPPGSGVSSGVATASDGRTTDATVAPEAGSTPHGLPSVGLPNGGSGLQGLLSPLQYAACGSVERKRSLQQRLWELEEQVRHGRERG